MNNYEKMDEIGRGSYGIVYKALDLQNGEVVAIKKLYRQHYSMEDCLNMREVNSLIALNDHQNIVKLKDIINEDDVVFLVFEYMDCSLHDRIVASPLSESEIRNMCFQILQGLAYMHHKGFIHRDLKPANLLVSKDVVKIGDFGFACETRGGRVQFTRDITTPAYRAPEVFLHSPVYDTAVDMWAVGVIMVEMFTRRRWFTGSSSAGVMNKICGVLGTPTESTWPGGLDLASKIKYRFPDLFGSPFSALLPSASSDAVNLIASLLSWDPSMRLTAMDALQHPFFDRCYHVPPFLRHEPPAVTLSLIAAPVLFQMAMERERLKMERSEGSNEDVVRMLPEHLYDFEIEKTSLSSCTTDSEGIHDSEEDLMNEFVKKEETKCRFTQGSLWSGLSKSWIEIFYKYKGLMQQ